MSRIMKWRVWLISRHVPFAEPTTAYVYMFGDDQRTVENIARLTYRDCFWYVEEDCL